MNISINQLLNSKTPNQKQEQKPMNEELQETELIHITMVRKENIFEVVGMETQRRRRREGRGLCEKLAKNISRNKQIYI